MGCAVSIVTNSSPLHHCPTLEGHNFKLSKAFCRTNQSFHFYSNRVVLYWNSLPYEAVNAQSLNIFIKELNKVDFTQLCLIKHKILSHMFWSRLLIVFIIFFHDFNLCCMVFNLNSVIYLTHAYYCLRLPLVLLEYCNSLVLV